MKKPKEEGAWEVHPCDLPLPPGPSVINSVWRCHCSRRWVVKDVRWDTDRWLGQWEEVEPVLDADALQRLEDHANTRPRRWRHR